MFNDVKRRFLPQFSGASRPLINTWWLRQGAELFPLDVTLQNTAQKKGRKKKQTLNGCSSTVAAQPANAAKSAGGDV